MKKGYITVKTRHGIAMAKLAKGIEALTVRLETIGLCRPGLGLEAANLSVYDFCEQVTASLEDVSTLFQVLPGQPNSEWYRQVIRDTNYGKRRRLVMRSQSGEKLFKATVSLDRMCAVVVILARQQLITGGQAKEFFDRIEKIIKDLAALRQDLGRLLANAEAAVDF